MLVRSLLIVLVAFALGFAAQQAGVERHEDAKLRWAASYPDTWKVRAGADGHTTIFEAPADEEIDLFIETFSVMARKQAGAVTLAAAIEAIKKEFAVVNAELLEEEQGNVRLGGRAAARLIWKLQLGGIDLRLAQLVTVVDDTVYLCTFTVEASKAGKFERLAHDMFNRFELLPATKSPAP